MIIKELTYEEFEPLRRQLIQKAHKNPMEFSFDVTMTVNKTEYCLKVQPDQKHKITLLQAVKVERTGKGQAHEPVNNKAVLTSLFELLVFQGVAC